jgi:hypothetical protein
VSYSRREILFRVGPHAHLHESHIKFARIRHRSPDEPPKWFHIAMQQGQPRRAGLALLPNSGMQPLFGENHHGSSNRGRPQSALVAHGRLRNVAGTHDFVGDAINLLLLVPTLVRIEINI